MSSSFGHRYDRALYAPLAGRVERVAFPKQFPEDDSALQAALDGVDIFHMHWPELLLEPNLRAHARSIELLRDRQVRIVWTQHNLLPHVSHRAWPAIYRAWANAASGVIHHSAWGEERAQSFRAYRPDAIHRVIRHGHWGELRGAREMLDREQLARPYKMAPDRVHLGVLGTPRRSRQISTVVEGFLASARDDLDLTIFSLADGEETPPHPRICGRRYSHVPPWKYNRRLAYLDVLLLPFGSEGSMLTTGLVGDAIGVAKPVIASDWAYLTETLGDAAMVYDGSAEDLARLLDELDISLLDAWSDKVRALQPAFAWERSAEETLALFHELEGSVA